MRFLAIRRQYRNPVTGVVSPLYAEACAGVERLTLNPAFDCAPLDGKWTVDPFYEVVTVPPRELDRVTDLEPIPCERLTTIIDAQIRAIEAIWDPTKAHVVFHSSGHDSRIISGCLKRLREKHGPGWIGKVLFLCNRWEAEPFRAIMRAQGWRGDQYAAYDEGPAEEHFAISLDFDSFWYKANAPVPMPGRFWWYLIEWAQSKGLLPDTGQIQAFHGMGQLTWHHFRRRDVAGWLDYQDGEYYGETSVDSPEGTGGLAVLTAETVHRRVLGYTGKPKTGHELRIAIADALCPETASIPNLHLHDHAAPISDRLQRRCRRAFARSWYAQHTGAKWTAPETSEIDPRWGVWGLASLCEHLINSGVEINVN
jgi:hypothetical protein